MQLRQLIERLAVKKIEGPLDREITGLAYDSRRVSPGMLFVAIAGQNVDGHDLGYAGEGIEMASR